ncbi:MAG: SdiA-regulated domain-containing protein, partial [Congregibacter sp.]|nr:SdiA-regulated domain-containing protein [Congregibacter sp.]
FPRLYALPLPALDIKAKTQAKTKAVPELLGEVRSIPGPSVQDLALPMYGMFRSRPTGMAHIPNGRGLVLLTYNAVFYAELGEDRNWFRALNDGLCSLPRPELKQAESIAADKQGRVYVTSEGKDAPLLRITPPTECRGNADGR